MYLYLGYSAFFPTVFSCILAPIPCPRAPYQLLIKVCTFLWLPISLLQLQQLTHYGTKYMTVAAFIQIHNTLSLHARF